MKKPLVGILALALSLVLITAANATGPASTWTKASSNPVIGRIGDGWDKAKVYAPYLLMLAGNPDSYTAYYTGNDGFTDRIGVATSSNGTSWTRYGANPVLTPGDSNLGEWDSASVGAPCVLYNGDIFKMWYSGHNGETLRIGLAESVDGTTWTKINGTPVLDVGTSDSWEGYSVGNASVIYQNGIYQMWYSGFNSSQWAIGYATSPDGVTWTKYGANPVLAAGSTGNFDSNGVWMPSVIYKDGVYEMFYTGTNGSNLFRIGMATSTDAVNWTRSTNAVLSNGAPGTFDQSGAWSPSVTIYKNNYLMLYTGIDGGDSNTIGFAYNIPPRITGPVRVSDTFVTGFGTAGSAVSIVNYPSGTTMGTGTISASGTFSLTLSSPLVAGTGLEAVVGADHSGRQTVMATVNTSYLPVVEYQYNQGW